MRKSLRISKNSFQKARSTPSLIKSITSDFGKNILEKQLINEILCSDFSVTAQTRCFSFSRIMTAFSTGKIRFSQSNYGTINNLHFSTFSNTYKQLMAAQPLIEKSPLYLDGIQINWKFANYLHMVLSKFERALLISDSDSFTVADSLGTVLNLLFSILRVDPGEFKDAHQE